MKRSRRLGKEPDFVPNEWNPHGRYEPLIQEQEA